MLSEMRLMTESYYDQQEVRKETAGRVRTVLRARLEKIDRTKPEKKKKKNAKSYGTKWTDKQIKQKLDEAIKKNLLKKEDYDYLNDLLEMTKSMQKLENQWKKQIEDQVEQELIYTQYLKQIRGIGPILAANLIANLGYGESFDTVSKLWRYSGLAVIDGKAERKKRGEKIHYNPKMKTLMYKVGDCFIKNGAGYQQIYRNAKRYYQAKHPKPITNPEHKKTGKGFKQKYTKMHIDLMARRKVEKIFLKNYWQVARNMKNLDCRPIYVAEKLDHKNIIEPFTDDKEWKWDEKQKEQNSLAM